MKVLRRLKRYVMQRRLLKPDVAVLLLFLLGVYGYQSGSGWYSLLPQREVVLNNPYLAQSDKQGNTYVIDDERSRVVKINREEEVEYLLKSNSRDGDTFTYAEDLTADPAGNVYVLDAGWDETGSAVAREGILVYDARGRYVDTLYNITYENEFVDKHRLFALTFRNNALYFVESDREGFSLFRVNAQTREAVRVAFYEYENAFDLIQDYAIGWEVTTVYALDKRGKLIKARDGEQDILYDTAEDPVYAGRTALYRLAVDRAGNVLMTDIRQNKLYQYTEGEESLKVFADQGQVFSITSVYTREDDTILGIWLESQIQMCQIRTYDDGQESGPLIVIPQISGDIFAKSSSYLLKETVFQLSTLAVILGFLWGTVRGFAFLTGVQLTDVQKTGILAAATAALVAGIIVTQLLNQFAGVYREELMGKLYILAHTISGMVDGESLERIHASEDYMNGDYQALMAVLEKGVNREDIYVQEMYCNVLRYEDGKGFAIAYQDNSIGTYYPRDEEGSLELASIYGSGREIQNEVNDATGSYLYVCVPVFNQEGKVVGVIEVGTTTDAITANIARMRQSILINLVLVVLVVLFLFGEALSFFDQRARYRKGTEEPRTSGQPGVPLHLLRFSIFVTYMAFNVASSFLPVYAAGFVTSDMGIPRELAASLPITFNLIFVGLTSVFCAPLLKRFSLRSVAAVSAGVCMMGDMTLFSGQNYAMLTLGLILNGIGVGLITNSINMFIAGSPQEEVRTEGFSLYNAGSLSGTNCGMILGASLAGALGQRNVFFCSAAAWIFVLILFLLLGKYMSGIREEREQKKNARSFLASRGVVPYLLLLQFPYVIINSFVFYYVPIYGAGQGFSESIVCLLLMLNSLCSVYLSVSLTKYMSEKLRMGSVYVSSILSFGALLLFGANSTVPVLIAVLLILGFSGSFGIAVRQMYFTRLKAVQDYGEESAMGVYNLMDNVGASAGPVLFGAIMGGTNSLPGLAAFVAVSGTMNGIYAVLSGRREKRIQENNRIYDNTETETV